MTRGKILHREITKGIGEAFNGYMGEIDLGDDNTVSLLGGDDRRGEADAEMRTTGPPSAGEQRTMNEERKLLLQVLRQCFVCARLAGRQLAVAHDIEATSGGRCHDLREQAQEFLRLAETHGALAEEMARSHPVLLATYNQSMRRRSRAAAGKMVRGEKSRGRVLTI
jgi:hypothetical protein